MVELFTDKSAWKFVGRRVKARRAIHDSPLSRDNASCCAGAIGDCVDFDELENLLYVDFGNGAIAAYPEEVTWP